MEQFKRRLVAGYLSVRTAGGATDRHYKWTYLLTYASNWGILHIIC